MDRCDSGNLGLHYLLQIETNKQKKYCAYRYLFLMSLVLEDSAQQLKDSTVSLYFKTNTSM